MNPKKVQIYLPFSLPEPDGPNPRLNKPKLGSMGPESGTTANAQLNGLRAVSCPCHEGWAGWVKTKKTHPLPVPCTPPLPLAKNQFEGFQARHTQTCFGESELVGSAPPPPPVLLGGGTVLLLIAVKVTGVCHSYI